MPKPVVCIQFLRFLAAFMVVVHHAQIALVHHDLADDVVSRSVRWTDMGAAGVHIFFVISGFIMVLTTEATARGAGVARAFLARRFVRIYPFYILCCVLYLSVFALVGTPSQVAFPDLILALALAPGYSAGIIGPGWTLAYEVYFYACFAAGLLLAGRRGLVAVTFFFVFCISIGMILRFEQSWLQVLTNLLLLEFLTGAWIAVLVLGPADVPERTIAPLIVVSLLLFLSSAAFDSSRIPTVLLWGVPSALLVLALAAQEIRRGAPRWMSAFTALGDASYALYLLHVLLLDIALLSIKALGGTAEHAIAWGAIGVGVSIIVALAAHRFVERPMLHGLRSRVLPEVNETVSRNAADRNAPVLRASGRSKA